MFIICTVAGVVTIIAENGITKITQIYVLFGVMQFYGDNAV